MQKDLVSIVIPVYNGSNYLAEAIESALNQTYGGIEILVVNDGSTDGGSTRRIAKGFKKVQYLEKENGGVASALNFGIRRMRGSFFSWLSHDDRYYPTKIEQQVDYYNSLNNENTIIYSHEDIINSQGNVIKKARGFKVKDEPLLYTLLYSRYIGGCSLLIPSHAFSCVGLFNENLKTVQDYDLWYRMIGKGYKFSYCPITSGQIRKHEFQDSKTKKYFLEAETDDLLLHAIESVPRIYWIGGMENKMYALGKLYFRLKHQGHVCSTNKITALVLEYAKIKSAWERNALFNIYYMLGAIDLFAEKIKGKILRNLQ